MPETSGSADRFDAVILAGGRARRLGGVEKPRLVVGDRTLLERVVAAVVGADRLIAVGPPHEGLPPSALVVREDPPGGGPVAALAAAAPHVAASEVVVLAADLPFVVPATVGALRTALAASAPARGVAVLVDTTGREQHLCAVWRREALRRALAELGDPDGAPMRRLLALAGPRVRCTALTGADGSPPPWFDCDTPADLAAARRWAREGGSSS